MNPKITVVISQAQGKNPVKRQLEEEIAAQLLMEQGVDVSVVPNLYDMTADHTGMLFLRSVPGDLVVLSWHYPRATRWVLDRHGVRGQVGHSLLVDETDEEGADASMEDPTSQGIGSVDVPSRKIYCIDLRVESQVAVYLEEIHRIRRENARPLVDLQSWVGGGSASSRDPMASAQPLVSDASSHNGKQVPPAGQNGTGQPSNSHNEHLVELKNFTTEDNVKRRWYPVIDYSRCTNCMECIDFCLFGVYGVDQLDRILVEAQDNCKKGCPACSRVCPENAIIFPQHKTPAIAGAEGDIAGFKIDLSQLFGGSGKSALELAVAERDAELVAEGREAVGMQVGLPKRQNATSSERDELDVLMDDLDALDV